MHSISAAMTWELFQRGRWGLVLGFLGANGLPLLILAALSFHGAIDPEDRSFLNLHVSLVQVNAVTFAIALLYAQGHPSRLYLFPIPASSLVAGHLIVTLLFVTAETVLSTALLNALFGVDWPLWGPAAFMAVAVAATQSVFWLTEKSVWSGPALGGLFLVLESWFMSRHGLFLSKAAHPWNLVTPLEALFLSTVALGAYFVASVAIRQARCGEQFRSERLRAWFEHLFDTAPGPGLPFRSATQAQFWFEWRQKGVMPALTLFGMSLGLLSWLLFSRVARDLYEGFQGGGAFLAVGGFIMGLVIGCMSPTDGRLEMGNFLATRPLTDTEIARLILKTVLRNVIIAWLLWFAGFLVLFLILRALQRLPADFILPKLGWWYFPALLLATWLTTSTVAVVSMAGRAWFALPLGCGVLVAAISVTLFSTFVLSPQEQQTFWHGVRIILAAVFGLGALWGFRAALRSRLLAPRTARIALGAWTAGGAGLLAHWWAASAAPLSTYLLMVGLCALALAPLAAAPLTVAWNRHR